MITKPGLYLIAITSSRIIITTTQTQEEDISMTHRILNLGIIIAWQQKVILDSKLMIAEANAICECRPYCEIDTHKVVQWC